MTLAYLLLLACASPIWRECYTPDEAFTGIEPQGVPLLVEWCDHGYCFEVGWTRADDSLVVYEVGMQGADKPEVCVTWADDGGEG